jgi:arylsulfatase
MMKQPNILLLFTDQQRFDTIAALGNPVIKTPALDRLVNEGTSFERCYTPSPVCVAARCALMTGFPPHKTGCFDLDDMPQSIPSFMERLRDAGYQTHGAGKMHFTPDHTRMWGFEGRDIAEELKDENDDFHDFIYANGYGHAHEYNGIRSEYYYIPQPSQLPASLHNTQWTGDRSIEFLRNRDMNRPFFLMSSFLKPHPPFESPTPWNKLYRASEMQPPFVPAGSDSIRTFWNEFQNRFKYRGAWGTDEMLMRAMRAAYYSCISFVDFQIGRILRELGESLDETLVIFTSDHGELLGDYGCVGKRTMQEVSVRVPLLARFPGVFPSGIRCRKPVTLLDVHETFLAAAGVSNGHHSTERQSLVRLLTDDQPRVVFSQFQQRRFAQYMASDGRWKYVYSAPDRKEILVDLESDPMESRNLAGTEDGARPLKCLRDQLWDRFNESGYADAVDGRTWREYDPPTLSTNPDDNLIFQDAADTDERLRALGSGYYRPSAHTLEEGTRSLTAVMSDGAFTGM